MTPNRQDDTHTAEKAAEWLIALDEGGPEVQEAFAAWLGESARNVEEFLLVSAVCREAGGHDPQRRIDVASLVDNAHANVVSLSPPAFPPDGSGKRLPRWLMAAAVAAVLAAGGWALAVYPQWYGYSTSVGEQRVLELADGSVIHLNTASRVKVHFSDAGRDIQLVGGEALFRVVPDPARPFRVHAGRSTIQALGTQFNIYMRMRNTIVSVIDGSVRVSSRETARTDGAGVRPGAPPPGSGSGSFEPVLTAGEAVDVASTGEITRPKTVDTVQVGAWRQRRLVFVDDLLADVVAEFNRYNRTPRLRVEGEAAAQTKLSGVFDADDPESLLLFLQGLGNVSIERKEGDAVIIRRN